MTKEELYKIIATDESFRIERTTSKGDMDKFQEAICAFANDIPGSGKKGCVSQVVPSMSQVQLTKSAIVLVALMKNTSLPISVLMEGAGETNRSRFRNNILNPLIETQLVEPTQKYSPQSPKQEYALTDNGTELLKDVGCMRADG